MISAQDVLLIYRHLIKLDASATVISVCSERQKGQSSSAADKGINVSVREDPSVTFHVMEI